MRENAMNKKAASAKYDIALARLPISNRFLIVVAVTNVVLQDRIKKLIVSNKNNFFTSLIKSFGITRNLSRLTIIANATPKIAAAIKISAINTEL